MLKINNLSKIYKRAEKNFYAIKNINLNIERGDFIHIIGRSGSGKSTLLNIIAGLLTPDEGEVILNDVNYTNLNDDDKSKFRNEKIGFIPQSPTMLSYLTVLENIILPYDLYNREDEDIEGKAKYLLDELGASYFASSYPSELSGGELRKVIIARALINSPDIIIADEPTSDLDIENTKEVMEMLNKLNSKGTTVIVVTHELDTLKYGKKVFTMSDGILKEGKYL